MKIVLRPFVITFIASSILLIAFSLWYSGGRGVLTLQEQEAYVARVIELQDATQGFLNPVAIKDFLASDDGQPFYVINLFKFKPTAIYADGRDSNLSGAEAFTQFSTTILPAWIKKGIHPVFVTKLNSNMKNDWDVVGVVRYPSRRDYIAMVTNDAFIAALPHRLAAAEKNIRVQLPGRLIPNPIVILLVLFSIIVLVVYLVEKSRTRSS